MENPVLNEKTVIKWMAILFTLAALAFGSLEAAGYLWERNLANSSLGWPLVASRRLSMKLHEAGDASYYVMEPGKDYQWSGVKVHINSHGFRTPEFTDQKQPGTFRILSIGDSIDFGWSVAMEDTYNQVLQRDLNARAPDGQRVEVIAAGVPAWNLDSEEHFLLEEGLSYQPDLVMMDLTILNDISGAGFVAQDTSSAKQWLKDHTYGWSFLTTNARFLLSHKVGPEAIPALNPPKNADAYYPLSADDPAYTRAWRYIHEMNAACRERGIPFVLVIFPTAYQVNSLGHPDIPQQVFARLAQQEGIPLVNLLPVYKKICESSGSGACEGYDNLLFADVWMHPNPYAHQVVAREIEAVIDSRLGFYH